MLGIIPVPPGRRIPERAAAWLARSIRGGTGSGSSQERRPDRIRRKTQIRCKEIRRQPVGSQASPGRAGRRRRRVAGALLPAREGALARPAREGSARPSGARILVVGRRGLSVSSAAAGMVAGFVRRPPAHPGRVPERPKGAVCKIAGNAFTGSNPVPATLPLSCGNRFPLTPIAPPAGPQLPSRFPPPDASPTRPAGHAPDRGRRPTRMGA
jgi:hypothetical protein